jgi:VanZ family protein
MMVARRLGGLLSAWLAVVAWVRALTPLAIVAFLWGASSVTPSPRPPSWWRDYLHNGAHVVAFGGLAGAILLARSRPTLVGPAPSRSWPWLAAGLAFGYGIIDEWHQAHVPGRVCSFGDLLSDASGAGSAVVFALAVLREDPRLLRCLPWCVLLCLGCVAAATWLPW